MTSVAPLLARWPRLAELVEEAPDAVNLARLRRAASVGRPLGDDAFVARLEVLTRRELRPGRRGPKPAEDDDPRQGELNALSP